MQWEGSDDLCVDTQEAQSSLVIYPSIISSQLKDSYIKLLDSKSSNLELQGSAARLCRSHPQIIQLTFSPTIQTQRTTTNTNVTCLSESSNTATSHSQPTFWPSFCKFTSGARETLTSPRRWNCAIRDREVNACRICISDVASSHLLKDMRVGSVLFLDMLI
jgi:hypothetical protein